ncbi:hypothetical protein OIU79_009105 [Salix purpurea]
MELMQ